jgi:hypothetical protein
MKHEMKLVFENYVFIIPIDNSYIDFNNNKRAYTHITLHKISELYTKQLRVCPNITSKFRTTIMFKIFVKENNYPYKTCRHVHNLTMCRN